MGLMRRVESSIENAVGEPLRPAPASPPPSRRDRAPGLHVQPKELAQKLVKEMEDHKVGRQGGTSVSNRFTVYLCDQDYDRYAPRLSDLIDKLERGLAKHVRSKRYEPVGDLEVRVVRESDLRPGYFGILAERFSGSYSPPAEREQPAARASARPPATPAPEPVGGVAAVHDMPARSTCVIPPSEVAALDLAAQAIVLRAGNRAREFTQGRIVVGRARDVDFRLDDPNVSRRHAALYWSEGEAVIEDLGSTNGTLLNGQPVTSAVLRPNDVLLMGDSRVVVDIKSR